MNVDSVLVLQKILMLFLVLLCGVYARKRRFLDGNSTKSLSLILVNITQPLLIIDSFQIDYREELIINGLLILGASVIIHIVVTFIAKAVFRFEKNPDRNSVLNFGLVFGNCAFLGYPVLEVIFGDGIGVFYGAFYCIMFNLYCWTYGVSLYSRKEKTSFKKIFLNAGTIATALGIVLFAVQYKLPSVLKDAVSLVGDMTFPLSMLIVGSLISQLDFIKVITNVKAYIFCFVKLLVLPMIAILVCKFLPLSPTVAYMSIVMCAVPTASNTAIFAQAFDSDASFASQCVGLSTFFSIFTIPLTILAANMIL